MVPPEDEADARAAIRHATVVPWRRFPHAYSKAARTRTRTRTLALALALALALTLALALA